MSRQSHARVTVMKQDNTAQCDGMGDLGSDKVRAGTTSPMPEHKGLELQ